MPYALIIIIGLLFLKKNSYLMYHLCFTREKAKIQTQNQCIPGATAANFTQAYLSPQLPGWYRQPDIILETELEQNNQVDAF